MTDAEDLLLEIANSMNKDFLDPAEHANWCVEVAQGYFTKKREKEIEQEGREGREAFAKACAEVDGKRGDQTTPPESP